MRKAFVTTLLVLLVAAAPVMAQTIEVPRVSGIEVDGLLGDWVGVESHWVDPAWTHADGPDVQGAADLSMRVWLGYDDEYFYFAARVTDNALVFERPADSMWQTDSVELWLNNLQVGMGRTQLGGLGVGLYAGGQGLSPEDVQLALVEEPNGYTVEAAIPASEALQYVPGAQFKIAFGVNDADQRRGTRKGQIYFPVGWQWNQLDVYADAVLAAE